MAETLKQPVNTPKKHTASPYLVERLFAGDRGASDVAADLIKAHGL